MHNYNYKIDTHLFPLIRNLKKPIILEFGVQNGRSTKKFLKICDKNNGKLFSIDVNDCSNISKNSKWTFFKSRDDNFEYLKNKIPKKIDIIFLDTLHEAAHVEKIFYYYYNRLKVDGYFFIDDTSFLPYLQDQKRNSFYCEINNSETYTRILEIYLNNSEFFDLSFSYIASGLAIIRKKKMDKLKKRTEMRTRKNSLKNIIRLIWNALKKN